jgi:polyisoprenoid-binding protein YceI
MAKLTYQIDPAHSSAQFSIRHMMISNVRGEFPKLSGAIVYDPEHPEQSSVDVTIDVSSISTREAQRDTHLKSADFFDAEKFPTITFKSKEVVAHKNGDVKLKGDLTIRGVTREVVLDVEGPTPESKDPWGNQRIGGSATTKINRKDFGLTWNSALETGGLLVGDEVKITLDIEAIRQSS